MTHNRRKKPRNTRRLGHPFRLLFPLRKNWKIALTLLTILGFLGLGEFNSNASLLGVQQAFSHAYAHANAYIRSAPDPTLSTSKERTKTQSETQFKKAKQLIPNPLMNFHEAKQEARQLFKDHRHTFYCGCKFDKHNRIDLASCGYIIQQDKRRAQRLEWEHIVPISHLASNLDCWKKPLCCNKGKCFRGRKCCQQIDPDFAKMEADLHNLVPEIGELNALRSNYRFGELPWIKAQQFGQCEMKIDAETRRVEPRVLVRGIIARAYLYMSDTYDFPLSDSQRQLFSAWNKQYPPDAWEIEWDNRIFRIQGNHNLYISQYGQSDQSGQNRIYDQHSPNEEYTRDDEYAKQSLSRLSKVRH